MYGHKGAVSGLPAFSARLLFSHTRLLSVKTVPSMLEESELSL